MADFGIRFNQLFTITNMPIKRFRQYLQRTNNLDEYLSLLADNYNPQTLDALMCLHQISVSWDGHLYDCDFNQMVELTSKRSQTSVFALDSFDELLGDEIALANHCYGCTAGAGSSCGGALENEA